MYFRNRSNAEMKKFLKWLDNYWYHYKWVTLIVAFFLVCGVVFTLQMCHKQSYDLYVVYAGPTYLDKEGHASILSSFRQMMTEDFNDDGEKNINYKQIIYVPPEIADEYTENSLEFNEQINNEALRQYSATMQTGEYIICLIDESLYQQTRDNGLYLPLSDIFGSIPENAYDEYGFRLKDLPFGNSMSGVNSLSADTILCVRRPNVITSIWGGDSAEALYDYHLKIFRNMVEYQAPEA